ncbi:transposon Ty3-I Gag-Pol polyprotein, partial [Trichonephila clavipes]
MDNSLHGLLNTICKIKALPTAEVDEIAKFLLEEIVLRHGAPRVIITDREPSFDPDLFSLVDLCNIDHRFQTAYHPQTNGLTGSASIRPGRHVVNVLRRSIYFMVEAETTPDTMLPFCPNDFDDNNITKIAARAEESRQLAQVHNFQLKTKIVDVTIPNTKWYPYAPGDLVWVYT